MPINYFISLSLIVFATLMAVNTAFTFRIKNSHGARAMSFLSAVIALYSFAYSFELYGISFESMKFFNAIRIISYQAQAPCILLLSYSMAKKNQRAPFFIYFPIILIPLVTIILRLTSSLHSFYMHSFALQSNVFSNYLMFGTGAWYYISNIFNIVLLVFSIALFAKSIIKAKRNYLLSVLMICAISLPLAAEVVNLFGYAFQGISVMPFVLPLSCIFLIIGTVKYRIFHPVPFAHSKVFEWSENGILVLDNELNLLDFNPTAKRIFPHISRNSVGTHITQLFAQGDQIKDTILLGTECCTVSKIEGETKHFQVCSSSLPEKNNISIGYMVTFSDITTLVNTMKELTDLASTDTLTGAQTRRHFSSLAQIEFMRSKRHKHPLSFIMLDLDFFKNINDRFGHRAGDELLKYICSICLDSIRSIDLLGRFGGEEFMILLPETNLEGAIVVAKRIRGVVEASTLVFEGHEMNITVSLGVTGVDCVTDEDLDLFLKYADRALYRAKNKGRNGVQVMHLPVIAK